MTCVIKESPKGKVLLSENYKYIFNKVTGEFIRFGKTITDDPDCSPYGPEILDMEISTTCHGINGVPCTFCYKTNTVNGTYMNFDKFIEVFEKIPKTVTQIAFGIGDIDSNPDLWKIMKHCRNKGVIPNITINGARLTDESVENLVKYCGAVAVSLYDYDLCYNTVKRLTDAGLTQVNIHCLLSKDTYTKCLRVLCDKELDERLKNLKSIVYLWLKPKGDRNTFRQLDNPKDFKALIDYAFDKDISIGFDSCSACNFLKMIKDRKNFKQIEQSVDACESTLFSYYINVNGLGFPCSFSEDTEYFKGIDISKIKNFQKEVWSGEETVKFRNMLLNTKNKNELGCRECPIYTLSLILNK